METVQSNKLTFLEDRNVFIFDTETTGLPERVPGSKWGSADEYWPYHMNKKYASSRIVSISWVLANSFNKSLLESEYSSKIKEYIRYPEDFNEIPTTHIHGISITHALNDGIPLSDIVFNCGLADALEKADYIMAHNVMFDIHILENELYRLFNECKNIEMEERLMKIIQKIEAMKFTERIICTGELGKNICQLEFKSRNGKDTGRIKKWKMPKLKELHMHLVGVEHENQHSAGGDVLALLRCISRM